MPVSAKDAGHEDALPDLGRPDVTAIEPFDAGLLPVSAGDGPVEVTVEVWEDSPWSVYPPGEPFEVSLLRQGGQEIPVTARWVDARGGTLGAPFELQDGVRLTVRAPSGEAGYYGLVFASTDPRVVFPPQPAGFDSSERGFAVLSPPALADPTDNSTKPSESAFGVVHGDVLVGGAFDPYLRGHHIKTLTWNTASVFGWARVVSERQAAGLTELPVLSDEGWDTDGSEPIGDRELGELSRRFARYASAAPVLDWELGVEENLGNRFQREGFYLSNLARKAEVLRRELTLVEPEGRLVYNLVGFDYDDYEAFADSGALEWVDVLSTHPYRWTEFETPEGWLRQHIERLRRILAARGSGDVPIWMTEVGVPVRGTRDPDGFFGYPNGNAVEGVSRDYAAQFMVKAHAVALAARVQRVYWYNYQNRGNDIRYAEDHFGLRAYAEGGGPGAPLPAYVAYVVMLNELAGARPTRALNLRPGVWLYEFRQGARITLLVWSDRPRVVRTSRLLPNEDGVAIESVFDLYGTPVVMDGSKLALDERPVYLAGRVDVD